MSKSSYSLLELNTFIKRIIALNFDQDVWVKSEILSLSIKNGHYYLTLIQKDQNSNNIVAQINATIWATDVQKIKKLSPDLDSYFIAGHEILVQGIPIFHEKFGLQLRISGIDTAFTRGALDQKKEELFVRIRNEALDQINKTMIPPPAFQNIAVISSSNAAGYIDFISHISHNAYNFKYNIQLFDSVMQGQNLETDMMKNLDLISNNSFQFDALVIIRGGGSKVDLAAFDNYLLAHRIANFPIPVLTGIGHDIDISSLDLVAHKYFKTPTAVAEFLIEVNVNFMTTLQDSVRRINNEARVISGKFNLQLQNISIKVENSIRNKLLSARHSLDQLPQKIIQAAQMKMSAGRHMLESIAEKITLQNPLEVIKKGYAIVVQNNRKVKSVAEFDHTNSAELNFSDGIITIKAE